MDKKCDHCQNTEQNEKIGKLQTCSKCFSVYYCSKQCQIDDWQNHKVSCKILNYETDEITQYLTQIYENFKNNELFHLSLLAYKDISGVIQVIYNHQNSKYKINFIEHDEQSKKSENIDFIVKFGENSEAERSISVIETLDMI